MSDHKRDERSYRLDDKRNVNKIVEGTPLPKVPDDVIDAIIHENWKAVFPHWA